MSSFLQPHGRQPSWLLCPRDFSGKNTGYVWATPGESEGQRSQACRGPWGHKELDTTERLNNNTAHLSSLFLPLPVSPTVPNTLGEKEDGGKVAETGKHV